MSRYGNRPVNLGRVDLNPVEMKFWMYCPVKTPGSSSLFVPESLREFRPLLERVWEDLAIRRDDCLYSSPQWRESYVYLTAKTLYVTADNPGNRPGWHSDGFRTNDLNYIWYDRAPTEFTDGKDMLFISLEWEDGPDILRLMSDFADRGKPVTYPNKDLIRLDESVIHRTPRKMEPGMRTFVKISVSKDKYDLEGNSINPLMGPIFEMKKRNIERNHPASVHS